jgi:hypothetical protein
MDDIEDELTAVLRALAVSFGWPDPGNQRSSGPVASRQLSVGGGPYTTSPHRGSRQNHVRCPPG